MNYRPMLGLIALLAAVTGAIAVVLLLAGMPSEAFAATSATPGQSNSEPGPLTLLGCGIGVALWVSLRRSR